MADSPYVFSQFMSVTLTCDLHIGINPAVKFNFSQKLERFSVGWIATRFSL